LEDERGEKRDYFLGLIGCQGIVQHDLGENELVDRIDLTSDVKQEAFEETDKRLTSHATRPFSETVEFASRNLSSFRTSTRCS
jgi:hypothetical protein